MPCRHPEICEKEAGLGGARPLRQIPGGPHDGDEDRRRETEPPREVQDGKGSEAETTQDQRCERAGEGGEEVSKQKAGGRAGQRDRREVEGSHHSPKSLREGPASGKGQRTGMKKEERKYCVPPASPPGKPRHETK